VRLITRNDASLTVALIAASVILFRQPLRVVLEVVRSVEGRFHLDLLPALMLLVTTFTFHQYRKSVQARAEATAAAADAAQARLQSRTLQQLMAFGKALANALDCATLQQVLWQHLPGFASGRTCWVLVGEGERWEILVQDGGDRRSLEALQCLAMRSLQADGGAISESGGDACFPMMAAGRVVGVLGVGNSPALSAERQDTLGAAAAVMAIGVRNMQQLVEARESSLRDSLTGCFNRGYALEALENELRRARRTGGALSVLMLDVDHFKAVNDRYGHVRGDEMLTAIAARLAATMRSSDIRCRIGGDEFLIILPETPSLGAQQIADVLRQQLSDLTVGPERDAIAITVSIGVASAIAGELDVTALIDRADGAMYDAKSAGRNRLGVAVPPSLSDGHFDRGADVPIAQAM
jgi:diguanylate cyclase (GGDEF)-like protein